MVPRNAKYGAVLRGALLVQVQIERCGGRNFRDREAGGAIKDAGQPWS
jgi:hypothetical protein